MAETRAIQSRTLRILARHLLAPILAPIAASVIVAVIVAVIAGLIGVQLSVRETINLAGLSAVWALPVTFVVGMSWHALAYRRRWRGLLAYVTPGLAVGFAIPALILAPFSLVREFGTLIALSCAVGGLTGLFFWLIRRPDRDPANPDRRAS